MDLEDHPVFFAIENGIRSSSHVRAPTYRELVLMDQIKAAGGKPRIKVLTCILGRDPSQAELGLFGQLAEQKRKRVEKAIAQLKSEMKRDLTKEELLERLT